jgi:charged multivesicular body protein 2A
MKSQQTMSKAMGSITLSMRTMNRQMNLPVLQKMMMEFEKQSAMSEMKQEMVEDILDDVLSAEQEEEDADQMVNSVFDEIGISFAGDLSATPSGGLNTAVPAGHEKTAIAEDDADLQARLDNLRKF